VVLKKALVLLVDEPASGALEAESVRVVQDALEREDVYVAGSLRVEARYCVRLALRDVGTGEGFLNHQSWLCIDNTKLLFQGDAVGIKLCLKVGEESSLVNFGGEDPAGLQRKALRRWRLCFWQVAEGEGGGERELGVAGSQGNQELDCVCGQSDSARQGTAGSWEGVRGWSHAAAPGHDQVGFCEGVAGL
jgi:hypothetical protein